MGEPTRQQWEDAVNRFLYLSDATTKRNAQLEARVAELEREAAMWRGAHAAALEASEQRAQAHQSQVSALHKHISKDMLFENQNPLIVCVVNGDKKLFNEALLVQGYDGGLLAAKGLTQKIAGHLSADGLTTFARISFLITIYFNRAQLLETLVGCNICSVQQFDAFLAGFSKTSPRFSFVDVGYDGADEKIKEYVQTYARFPQTLRVFIAGVSGPQYISAFDALRNEQLIGKFGMLLAEWDGGSINMPFPSLRVDELFMNPKLQRIVRKPAPTPLSSPVSPTRGRPIDPTLPLHKQTPPPCNEHYLMTCSKQPAACKYSHEYILTEDQLASLASNAKKAPCNWLKNGLICPYGDQCCWGHVCPNGPKCFHLSKGKCWFKGDAMHPTTPSESRV